MTVVLSSFLSPLGRYHSWLPAVNVFSNVWLIDLSFGQGNICDDGIKIRTAARLAVDIVKITSLFSFPSLDFCLLGGKRMQIRMLLLTVYHIPF